MSNIPENVAVSCDICNHAILNSEQGIYECTKHLKPADSHIITKCDTGSLNEELYKKKFSPVRLEQNSINKYVVTSGLEKLRFHIRDKSNEEIANEIDALIKTVSEYRDPNKCSTCNRDYCALYAKGHRDCNCWC